MAIPNALSSVTAAYDQSQSTLLAAAGDIASGNLDNIPSDYIDLIAAQTQFSAAAQVFATQDQMTQSLLDIKI